MAQFVCKECREEISPEASTCPHCGFQPVSGRNLLGTACILLGGVLCLTVIGIVAGVPMILLGFWWNRKNTASPAVETEATDE